MVSKIGCMNLLLNDFTVSQPPANNYAKSLLDFGNANCWKALRIESVWSGTGVVLSYS
jgi:hypothetical protein